MTNLKLKIGSDHLYLDVDEMMTQVQMSAKNKDGDPVIEINLPKFEFFKTMIDSVCNIGEDIDDTLGVISLNKLTVSSKLAINTLIKYNIIKKL